MPHLIHLTPPKWVSITANWVRENRILVSLVLGCLVLLAYIILLFSGKQAKHESMQNAQRDSMAKLGESYKDIRVIRTYDRGMGFGVVTFVVRGVICQLPFRPLDGEYVIDATEAPPVCSPVPLT